MQSLVNYFAFQNDLPSDVAGAVDELKAELNKNAEKAAANRALYEQTREIVLGAIAEKPMTIAEIWDAVKGEVPEGMTKSKVQYALREYWASDVEKTVGKVMEYKRA